MYLESEKFLLCMIINDVYCTQWFRTRTLGCGINYVSYYMCVQASSVICIYSSAFGSRCKSIITDGHVIHVAVLNLSHHRHTT